MSLIESLLLTCVTIIAAALGKLLIGGITWLVSKIPVLGAILDFLEEVADINIVGILNLFIFAGLGLGIRKAATRSRLGRFGTVLSFILLILLAVVLFVSPRLVDYWLHVRDISVAQSTLFKEAIAAVDRNLLEEVGYSGFVGYYLAVVRGFWVRAANIFFFVVSLCLAILGWWDPKYSE
jgi:hypothetical protein